MEIEYTNYALNSNIFKIGEINGIISLDDNFMYKNLYDNKKLNLYDKIPLFMQLKAFKFGKDLEFIDRLIQDFNLDKNVLFRKVDEISDSEKIKVSIIKLLSSNSKVIVLKFIDNYLNSRDLQNIFNTMSGYLKEKNKTVVFETTNIDNVVKTCENIIVTKNNEILFQGSDFSKMPVTTSLMEFANLANAKGANIGYYKDVNDLLKAVYRSVSENKWNI